MPTATVRFWAYLNGGHVKLTLQPDQELYWGRRARTEEGFEAEYRHWYYEDGHVVEEWGTDSRDCDGRHRSGGESRCRVDNLQAVPVLDWTKWHGGTVEDERELPPILDEKGKPMLRPAWEEGRPTAVYDQYAQMAGY